MVVADVKVSSVTFEKACCIISEDDDNRFTALLAKEGAEREGSPEKAKKWEFVDYESLPRYLQHNEFILGYYRSEWPLKETILSVFSIHNETINVWTHLVGFFIFLALTVYAAMMIPRGTDVASFWEPHSDVASPFSSPSNMTAFGKMYNEPNASTSTTMLSSSTYLQLPEAITNYVVDRFSSANETAEFSAKKAADDGVMDTTTVASATLQPITRWPFFVFLCGAMFCLLTSSACHLLSCHSEHTSYVMLHLDYAGISALIVTSILPQVYYAFACDPFVRNVYTAAIITLGIATVLVSLVPVFETPEFRIMRSLLFVCMGLLGWVPIVHKLMLFGDRPEALLTTLYEFLMNTCYGIGVVIYATRVPERWMPGKFDLVGHSHQLFHLLVIAGAYMQYLAVLVYIQWRDAQGC